MNAPRSAYRLFVAASGIALVACSDPSTTEDRAEPLASTDLAATSEIDDGGAPARAVLVRVEEFMVKPSRSSAKAGTLEFLVLNKGTEMHEFVIVRTDLTIDELPTNEDGSFDEEGEGVGVIDEIEEIQPGTMERITVSLEPGHYVLLCNRVEVEEDGEVESHFMEGMHADFTAR
jgi:hypothetical protein